MDASAYIAMLSQNEGFEPMVYLDKKANPPRLTVGRGYNVEEPFIRKMIHPDVLARKRGMSKQEDETVMAAVLPVAIANAQNFAGGADRFNKLSDGRKMALVDMAYQLGINRLMGFKDTRKALMADDYNTTADEILNSEYRKQVPNRAFRNATAMLTGQGYDPQAVMGYQRQYGLKPDGVVGDKTWAVLRKQMERK